MELPLTPLDFLHRARRLFANRVGVVEADSRFTYAAFAERADRLAEALEGDLDVRPGDRVAWLCGNVHELLEAYYGVLLAGAVLVPLNVRLTPAELRFCLEDCEATVLIRHPDQPDPAWHGRLVVLGDEYEELLTAQPGMTPATPPVDEHAAAEIFYTSGTTGRPKGVVLTHRGLYLHAIHSALTNGLTGEDVILHTIPLFHVNGWGTPHFVTALGGVHVMLPRFDAGEVLRLIDKHGVTRLLAVPTMMRAILDHPSLSEGNLGSLRQVTVGGAPLGEEMLAEIEGRLGCECIRGYGLTESGPTLTRSLAKPGEPASLARRATAGLPILGVDVRILDDHDQEVPGNGETRGEVCVRSNHVMAEYWKRTQETAEALRGGWLRTGDIGTVDADGYIMLVDRKKDLIISGGENISSVEVEHCIEAHPAVSEAAVVGMPHERWGEVPRAWVSLNPGMAATEAELIDWVRERLAHFKAPKQVLFLPELPKGGTGKIQKAALRARDT